MMIEMMSMMIMMKMMSMMIMMKTMMDDNDIMLRAYLHAHVY
jgi:hypothetical protein